MNCLYSDKSALMKKYDFVKDIGKGGYSTVSLVRSKARPDMTFACKIIPRQNDTKVKVDHEIQLMNKFRGHHEVIQLEEVFEDDENTYIIMENMTGGDIYQYFEEHKKDVSEDTVRKIIKKCLEALCACHSKNVVHNDIKPQNFMLRTHEDLDHIKLIDFGISLETEQLGSMGPITEGTPWFMAPESLSSKTCKKSDVWSIGIMTHLLLTGRFPFNDKQNIFKPSVYKIWNSILNDKLDFKKSYWGDISENAKDFIAKLLETDVCMRPTVYEALVHPWILGQNSSLNINKPLGEMVVEKMKKYQKHNIDIRSIFEEFINILLEKYLKSPVQVVDVLSKSPSNNSLYNTNKALVSMKSNRLAYLVSVLMERNITKDDKIDVKTFKSILKRMNSSCNLHNFLDTIEEDEQIDIKKIIASQMDWDVILSDRGAFTELMQELYDVLDYHKDIVVTTSNGSKILQEMYQKRNTLTFADFCASMNDMISQSNAEVECRVHGKCLCL